MNRIILENKLGPPDCERTFVRERLLAPFADDDTRLTIICADAGYGKTVFMAQLFSRLTHSSVWYRLDRTDQDPVVMLRHLVAGINRQVPDCCGAGKAFLRGSTDSLEPDALADVFISDFHEYMEPPFNFFLDDLHCIDGTSTTIAIIKRFIESLPAGVRFFISSRTRPELPLSVMRAEGELLEIGAEELRFTAEEVRSLFAGRTPGAVSREDLERILEETEGWPAALALVKNRVSRLAAGSSEGFVPRVFRDIEDYLREEIWFHIDDDLKRFLTRHALLTVMDPEICSAVTVVEELDTAEARRLLDAAANSNILVDRLGDSDEYRAHSLFRDFLKGELRSELRREEIVRLHLGYAAFFESRRQTAAAAHHLIEAGSTDELIRFIEKWGEAALDEGQILTLRYWLDQVPVEVLEQQPWLCYFKAQVSRREKSREDSARLLSVAQRGFIDSGDRHGLYLVSAALGNSLITNNEYDEALKILWASLDHIENDREKIFILNRVALSHLLAGRPEEAESAWNEARQACSDGDYEARLQIEVSLLSARYFTGNFRGIVSLSERLLHDIESGVPVLSRFIIVSIRSAALFETCQYADARATLESSWKILGKEFRSREKYLDVIEAQVGLYDGNSRESRRMIEEIVRGSNNTFLTGPEVPLVHIGNLDRHKRNFGKALERHQAALELCEESRVYTRASCLANIGADKQRLDRCSSSAGLSELDEAEALAVKCRAEYVIAQVEFHRAWRALQLGDEPGALALVKSSLGRAARNGYDHFVSQEGRISLGLLALAFAHGVESDYLLHIFSLIGTASLPAIAPALQSKDPYMREAAIGALAAAGGLSAMPRIKRMLRDGDKGVRTAARTALDSIREGATFPEDLLTRREYEVLEIVAEGATNHEIGERLLITEPTVKTHVSSIFRKLGVSTRVQAAMYFNQRDHQADGAGRATEAGGAI